ncbi:MAG: hypothetical protein MK066_13345 [Crocinitomicaceae bacterium]|nr:hypothetical protein [Crocinitomicaceae bacterium]
MKQKQKNIPVLLPSVGRVKYVLRALYSITNFAKASIVSIIVLLIILLLLTQMEQAFTMLLRMLEYGKLSLLICFLMINLLAISLSHYPIYTYYAANLNGSRKYVQWKKEHPINVRFLRWIWVFTFSPITNPNYIKDIYANILRQYLGLSVFLVWTHFIISTFEPNLMYSLRYIEWLKVGLYGVSLVPFFTYAFFKRRLSPLHSTVEDRKKIYKRLGVLYFISFTLTVVFMAIVFFSSNLFSTAGLLILLITNYAMMFNFVFFRLVRPRLSHVLSNQHEKSKKTSSIFLKLIKPLEKSSNYIVVFQVSFYISLISVMYFSLAALNDWQLPNGIAIVMIFIYIYFFIIGSIGKYYFVHYSMAKTEKTEEGTKNILNSPKFRYLTTGLIVLVISFFLGQSTESTLNELDIFPINEKHDGVPMAEFEGRVKEMPDTVFFVSSHGGGLKANTWTLMVMNEFQKTSNGRFMNQTVAMSGASGGSLGLALYGNIYGLHGTNQERMESIINSIQQDNYASIDICMLFGLDMSRIFYPLNRMSSSRDRAYCGMLKYQNQVRLTNSITLDEVSYRRYWQSIQRKGNYLPALIMNTASTNGKRGIFFSLNTSLFSQFSLIPRI